MAMVWPVEVVAVPISFCCSLIALWRSSNASTGPAINEGPRADPTAASTAAVPTPSNRSCPVTGFLARFPSNWPKVSSPISVPDSLRTFPAPEATALIALVEAAAFVVAFNARSLNDPIGVAFRTMDAAVDVTNAWRACRLAMSCLISCLDSPLARRDANSGMASHVSSGAFMRSS